jgi:hypothetical protein
MQIKIKHSLVAGGAKIFFHLNGKGNTRIKDVWGQPKVRVQYTEGSNEKGVCAENMALISGVLSKSMRDVYWFIRDIHSKATSKSFLTEVSH